MATNYPGSLDSGTQQPSPSASTEMDDSGFEHDVVHTNHSGAIIALETKVGTGSSTAVADSVLAGTGSGTSGWTTGPALASLTTTGSVGIGTASPNNLLSFGTPANGSRQIGLYENGTAHYGFGTDVNRLAIYASNSAGTAERVTVASDGKVGIGETAPENVLHVKQSGFSPSTNDDASIQVEGNWGGGVTFAENANRTMIYSPSGDKFAIRVGATASGGGTEAFYIKNDGKVGIGTNAPDTNLEVVGSVRTSTSFLVGGSGDDGIGPVTGQFGNVQTVGSGVGNYEGYSISGRAVFMHDGGTATGIYNDVNNHWILYSTHNGNTDLRHAGTWRIQANSAGASINGILTATSYVRGAGASAGSPAYSFSSDTNTGMYRVSSDHLGFSTGGALRATVASDGIHLASGDWFRSYGSAGWYSQSYAGGWYMIDTT